MDLKIQLKEKKKQMVNWYEGLTNFISGWLKQEQVKWLFYIVHHATQINASINIILDCICKVMKSEDQKMFTFASCVKI